MEFDMRKPAEAGPMRESSHRGRLRDGLLLGGRSRNEPSISKPSIGGTNRPLVRRLASGIGLLSACVGLLVAARVATARQLPPAPGPAPSDDTVVATVDGDPIRLLDVRRQITSALGPRKLPDDALPIAQARALEQVIYRRLITADFRRRGLKPTPEEEAAHDRAFAAHLARLGVSRDEYLKVNRLTDDDLAAFRYWDICWARFVREQLTDERLQAFFDAHRRDYDGTEVRVSHILLRVQGRGDQATAADCGKKAAAIRQDVLNGKLTFAEAAARFSAGPSREDGGDLGFIPRRERQGEQFSAAAFALKKGELSPPVLTPFGIHLITVTDEKPGRLTLKDVREAITPPATAEFFRETGLKFRTAAKVEYAGAIPHIDPTTGSLVPANR